MSLLPIVPGKAGPEVTLSGHSVFALRVNQTAVAIIRIDNNGNMYANNGNGYTQIDTQKDWVRPTSAAPGLYECRYTNHSFDPVSATATEDTWYSLSTNDFFVSISQSSAGESNAAFSLQIRRDGGPILASASYGLHAEYIFEPEL